MDWFDEKLKSRLNKPDKEVELENAGYEYLGWQLNGRPTKCKEAEHKVKDIQHNSRGSDCTYWCDECRYYYKIDMSD